MILNYVIVCYSVIVFFFLNLFNLLVFLHLKYKVHITGCYAKLALLVEVYKVFQQN